MARKCIFIDLKIRLTQLGKARKQTCNTNYSRRRLSIRITLASKVKRIHWELNNADRHFKLPSQTCQIIHKRCSSQVACKLTNSFKCKIAKALNSRTIRLTILFLVEVKWVRTIKREHQVNNKHLLWDSYLSTEILALKSTKSSYLATTKTKQTKTNRL